MNHLNSPNKLLKSHKFFINSWDFSNPNWATLPDDFPKLSKKGLTKEEGHLLDGIKLAWVTSEGRGILYKRVAKRVIVGSLIIALILVGTTLLSKTDQSITKSVSAKTVSTTVEEFVEATMSAVFRK